MFPIFVSSIPALFELQTLELSSLSVMAVQSAGLSGTPGPQDGG